MVVYAMSRQTLAVVGGLAAAAWSMPASAACVPDMNILRCTGVETNGAVASVILLEEEGATVRLDDPYSGASPRLSTVIVAAGPPSSPGTSAGALVTWSNSLITAPNIDGGIGVSTGEYISVHHFGTVRADASNSSGFRIGAWSSVAIHAGGRVDVYGNGNGNTAQNSAAGIILTGHYAGAFVQGVVQTTGDYAPGITTLSRGAFGPIAADGIVEIRGGGQILTSGMNSHGVILAGGSYFAIDEGLIAATGMGSDGVSLATGLAMPITIKIAAPAVISARHGAAIGGSGSDAIIINDGVIRSAFGAGIRLSGDHRDILTNRGQISGYTVSGAGEGPSIDLGGGDDVFDNSGFVGGGIDLGEGDDTMLLSGNWEIAGAVDGGPGSDGVTVMASGSPTMPSNTDLSRFSGFETLDFLGGSTTVGDLSFGDIATYAPLFVRPGSRITGNVMVAGGGGALAMQGTIIGNVEVYGQLSTGADRGTLRIEGDMSLGAGSNITLTMTPAVSDAIVVDGNMAIAAGAKLVVAGERPLTPGRAYTLISASGGIEGKFAEIEKVETVVGHVFQTSDAVQLLGTFELQQGANRQSERALGYINGLLIDGLVKPALLQALQGTLDESGYADGAALRSLSPEPYANASHIAVDSGLAIAAGLRSAVLEQGSAGPFIFAQSIGGWRTFRARESQSLSPVTMRSGGLLSGIGVAHDGLAVGGFVGYIAALQQANLSSSRTTSDGIVFGTIGRFKGERIHLSASMIFDRSKATTQRTLFTGVDTGGRYNLHGTTFDVSASVPVSIARDWIFSPQVGVTHVRVRRGEVTETGDDPLRLTVALRRYRATYVTGEFGLSSGHGSLNVGVRHRAVGDAIMARGGFPGLRTDFLAEGVDRQRTLCFARAGIYVDLAPRVRWLSSAESEIGNGGTGQRLKSEIRIAL